MMKNGIFAYLRNMKIDLYDNKFVNIYSHSDWINTSSGWFCEVNGVAGGPPNVVVDGSNKTAWASLDTTSENDKSILFDFYNKKLYVESFSCQTLCGPPKQVILEGSNDKGEKWFPFCKSNSSITFPFHSITTINCVIPSSYKMFRFRQIGENAGENYRFHIHNLEFYGKFIKPIFYTCKPNIFNHFIIIIFILILIYQEK